MPLEAIDTRYNNSDYLNDIPSVKEGMHEYLELVLHHPLLQSYEQNVRSLEKDLENQEQNYNNLKSELEKSMEENEDLREMLVKKTKELNRALEGSSSIPLPNENDRDRARRLGGTSEEMLHYIETMKNDQEALVDQIESLKIRNENLEKITEDKLALNASENHKVFDQHSLEKLRNVIKARPTCSLPLAFLFQCYRFNTYGL